MARRALLVGIDAYDVFNDLTTCVADAVAMEKLLERNADGSPNYVCHLMTCGAAGDTPRVTRQRLREACRQLFDHTGDVLFYFSGHAALTQAGGYLATYESQADDWGVPMQEIMDMATASPARDILLMLDCCHAGIIGNLPLLNRPGERGPLAAVRENMTIIAAPGSSESAYERGEHGLFTAALLDALDGGAADLMGWITAQSIYAYVERGFGSWMQRAVYKSHVTELNVVRRCGPVIAWHKLHQLVEHFPTPDYKFPLDPDYAPEEDERGNFLGPVDETRVGLAALFRDYHDAGLLRSSDGRQFYWVAKYRGTMELTPRGRECWRLVRAKRI